MKKVFFLFSFLLLAGAPLAQATVYLLGRNLEPLVTSLGHSFILVIPNHPDILRTKIRNYDKIERDLSNGKKGF